MAFGNSYKNQEAWSFLAKNAFKRNNRPSPYYKALYTNESFYNRMIEIYRTEFVPILENMIGQDLNTQLDRIQYASRMNSIRWQSMYDEWKQINDGMEIVQNRDGLIRYFVRRVSFLNSAWLEGKDYCTVQFESVPGNSYWNISIEKGDILETTYMDLVNTIWLDTKTGLPVDFLRPITEDMVVSRKIPEEISAE